MDHSHSGWTTYRGPVTTTAGVAQLFGLAP